MSEKEIEKLFVQKVREAGGRAYKFVSPGNSGMPDRLVVLPDGKIGFVEMKAPGKKSRPEQCYQQRQLENLGCYVAVADNPALVDQIIWEITEYTTDGVSKDILEAGGLV